MRPLVAATAGLVLGAVVTVAIQGGAAPVRNTEASRKQPLGEAQTFLAWVPRGLPTGFDSDARALAETGQVTTVAEDHAWLARSWSASGAVVDRTRGPYRLPIDTIAVDPASFAVFLSRDDRRLAAPIASGQGVLSATSASLRGLGPGAVMRFVGGRTVRIAAVLPDEAIGGAELMVSRDTGRAIGVHSDRYLLLRPAEGQAMRSGTLRPLLRKLLPAELGAIARVQVRTASETPLLRPGDSVLSTAQTKALFGEFAARPEPGRPGYLDLDPRWVAEHLVTTQMPLLGSVTCHRSVVDALRGAMRELRAEGLGSTIETYDGCFAPRFINRDPSAMLSHHSWGIAIDLNIAGNYYGVPPDQDPRLVEVMERWGFAWGGRYIVPDGNHFEYHREPQTPAAATPAPGAATETAEAGEDVQAVEAAAPAAPEAAVIETPPYFLAWTPGGLPPGFREQVGTLEGLADAVVFAGDTVWLTRSLDANGEVVDDPRAPYEHPLDGFAVSPTEVAPFLPVAVRGHVVHALERGSAVLGTRSAELRGLGVGGTLGFGPRSVRVGAVVPEELIGWAELLVSRKVGARLGIVDDRHLWAFPAGAESRRDLAAFERMMRRLVPAFELLRVEAPGVSPYMRVANGVNPPIVLKQAFGEFAAARDPSNPAFFSLAPAWVEANLVTRKVPLLGTLTCHREFMQDLMRAMNEVRRRGLGPAIHSTAGCFNARTVARSPTNPPSFHAYGAAVDINAPENAFGAQPSMDPRVVAIFERLGFNWGGDFLIPDGMHFEYGGGPLVGYGAM
ncbi:MAG: M15 family metallopeptidase [Actinomycetota bacterium]